MAKSVVKRVQTYTRKVFGSGTGPGNYQKNKGYWSQRRRKNLAGILKMQRKMASKGEAAPLRNRTSYKKVVGKK